MSRILIDQEDLRTAASELRSIDSELDALRGRMRGAALGAMPPEVVARIGATTARSDVVLYGHGERLRLEAGRLEWRAAAAEVAGGTNPALRSSFDFLDRSGLLGLASLAGIAPSFGALRRASDGLGTLSGRVQRVTGLYLSASSLREMRIAAGRHSLLTRAPGFGRQAHTFAQRAHQYSGRVGKLTGWVGTAFTAGDIFAERSARGRGAAHAGVDTAAIMGTRTAGTVAGKAVGTKVGMVAGAAVGSVFGPAGTLVGGAVGGFVGGVAGGWIGGEIGERIGEWGVDHAEETIGSTLQSAEDLAEDAGRAAAEVADRAGDALEDVGAVKDKLKFW